MRAPRDNEDLITGPRRDNEDLIAAQDGCSFAVLPSRDPPGAAARRTTGAGRLPPLVVPGSDPRPGLTRALGAPAQVGRRSARHADTRVPRGREIRQVSACRAGRRSASVGAVVPWLCVQRPPTPS